MTILAIEFSPPQRSVAVLHQGKAAETVEATARETDAFGMIEKVLRDSGLEREQIKCLAIGLGPGSYHGIRAAISIAQGWQLANGVKILGISTAETVAAQARAEGIRGGLRVVIDAQRSEFYTSRHELKDEGVVETEPLHIATREQMEAFATSGELLAGPEVTRWFSNGRVVIPRATTLAQLAATRTNFIAGEKLEPIYLRETTFVKAPPRRVIQ